MEDPRSDHEIELMEQRLHGAGYDPHREPLDNIARALFSLVAALEDMNAEGADSRLGEIASDLSDISETLREQAKQSVED